MITLLCRYARRYFAPLGLPLLLLLASPSTGLAATACAADCPSGGPLGIDRLDEREDRGIFSRNNQKRLDVLMLGGLAATALWQGTDTPLGKTAWKTVDGVVTTAVATEVMKNVFRRPRPSQNGNPDLWFQGKGNKSFPSGETAMMAAMVTPYIVDNHAQSPAVWGLILLPAYMGYARTASLGHWDTDVLAGAVVGAGFGYLAAKRDVPLVLSVTGHSAFVGWKQNF